MARSRPASRRQPSRLIALATVATALAAPQRAQAVDDYTYNWLGGNFDNWTDGNWNYPNNTAKLHTGTILNFGAADGRLLPLDLNGRINANLYGSDDNTFKTLNFAQQAWTMTGIRYFTGDHTSINVSSTSSSVTISNDLTMKDYSFITDYATLDLTVATNLTLTGLISEDRPTIGPDTTGILNKYGEGTLTLTNRNTYSGGTNVLGGRLIDHYAHGNYNNNGALQFHTLANQTYGGTIFGAGSFTKSGQGSLTMNGNVTYTGTTTVQEGRLILNSQLSTRSFEIGTGGELEFNLAGNQTLSKTLAGTGTFVKSGAGTFTLTGLDTHTGRTIVNAGTLIDLTPYGSYVTNATLELRNEDDTYLSGRGGISGSGSLVKSGAGNLFVSDNTYTGGTIVNAGRITDFDPHGDYVTNAALEFRTGSNQSYSGTISGTGTLTKSAYGTLILETPHSHTGGTIVAEGRLIDLNPDGNYRTDGDLELAIEGDVDLRNAAQRRYYSISGTGNLTKSGGGFLTLSATNSYGGSTTVDGGVLRVTRVDNVLPTSTDLTVNSQGTFVLTDGRRQTVASLSGGGTLTIGSGSSFTVGGASSTTFSGDLIGQGAFTKAGAGTLTRSGFNFNQGGTTVAGGRLIDFNPSGDYVTDADLEFRTTGVEAYAGVVSGSGTFTKSGNGVLTLTGVNTYAAGTTVTGGRLIDLNPQGKYTLKSDSTLEFGKTVDSTFNDHIYGSGTFVKSGAGTLTLNGGVASDVRTRIEGGTLKDNKGALQGDVTGLVGTTLQFDGVRDVFSSAEYSGAGALLKTGRGTLSLENAPANTGGVRVSGGTLSLRTGGAFGGGLTVDRDATLDNRLRGTLTVGGPSLIAGTLSTDRGSTTIFSGPVSGAGGFYGIGKVQFEGGYTPGDSPVSVSFGGNLGLGVANVLTMDLGGTAKGNGYDHLTVAGTAFLGGNLDIAYYGGFSAGLGQSFDLFDFGITNGAFDSISLPPLSNGLGWDTSALYTTGTIRVQSVPEPASLAALTLGGLALLRRRRTR